MESNGTSRICESSMIHCTVSQAPLSLVEFKTWPPTDLAPSHDRASSGSFCGLMPVPSFAMRFFKDFQRFCPLLPDLVLQLDSGERVNVHRVLFYCCSAYCRQKLKAQQLPSEKDCWSVRSSLTASQLSSRSQTSKLIDCPSSPDVSVIRVPQVDYESLRAVVDFVYSGGLLDRVCLDSLPKLRFAATLLGIDEMVTVCDSLFRVYQQGHQNGEAADNGNQLRPAGHAAGFPGSIIRLLKSEPPDQTDSSRGSPCKRNAPVCKTRHQRLPSVASVLAEMGPDSRLRLLPAREQASPVSIKQEEEAAGSPYDRNGYNMQLDRKRSSQSDVLSPCCSPSLNYLVQLIAYNKEDLVISEKYIYSSRITEFQPLLSTYNVLQYLDEASPKVAVDQDSYLNYETAMQQKRRHSLILFSLSTDQQEIYQQQRDVWPIANKAGARNNEECLRINLISNTINKSGDMKCVGRDTQRFALLCRLDFSDRNSLYACCQQVLTNFMRGLLPGCNGEHQGKPEILVELNLESLYCLKKSCGFKSSFRRESLLNTSECYKALAEYSRPEMGELPLVLLSCSGMFHLEAASVNSDERNTHDR